MYGKTYVALLNTSPVFMKYCMYILLNVNVNITYFGKYMEIYPCGEISCWVP